MNAHKSFCWFSCNGKIFLFEKTQNQFIPEILQWWLEPVYSAWLLNFPYRGDENLRLFDQCVLPTSLCTVFEIHGFFSGSKNCVTRGITVCARKETVDLFQCWIVGRVPVIIWLRKEAGHFEFSTVFINLMASLIEMYFIFIIIISKTMEL